MSYDDRDYYNNAITCRGEIIGSFSTEIEETISIPSGIFPIRTEKEEQLKKLEFHLARIVGKATNYSEAKGEITALFIKNTIHLMVRRYARKEKLPTDFVTAAEMDNGLQILIKTILFNHCKIKPTKNIEDEVKELINNCYNNKECLIVYDRVGLIQRFVHSCVDRHSELFNKNTLPTELMRDFLSACRLHLNIKDIKHRTPQYNAQLTKKSEERFLQEMSGDLSTVIMTANHDEKKPKKMIRHWRARHLHSLHYYNDIAVRNLMIELNSFQDEQKIKSNEEKTRIIYEIKSMYAKHYLLLRTIFE